MKQILFEVSQGTNFAIETMETDKDHVHILLDYEPSVARKLSGDTSRNKDNADSSRPLKTGGFSRHNYR
jgi:REP element-mobilizing transposase RayT